MFGIDLSQELHKDYEITGLDLVRSPQSTVHRFCKVDITDRRNARDVIANAKPDFVIHAAAWTDVDGCELDRDKAYRINSEGTKSVASACKAAGAILIYISTDFVFDGKKKAPYKENDKTGPLSVYGDSKLRGEDFIRKTPNGYFILRTSWLYGRCGNNFVDTIIEKAGAEKTLRVVDDQVGSPTYTKDLAKAIHKLLDKITPHASRLTPYGVYHISNSGSVSWYDYTREILKLSGLKSEVVPITSKELDRPAGRPAMSVLDNAKFIKFTGFRMRNWKTALKEYLREGRG